MAKRRMTIYLDPEIAQATRVLAARANKKDSEVVEEALISHLGIKALRESQAIWALDEEEAMRLAYEELHAYRAERDSNR